MKKVKTRTRPPNTSNSVCPNRLERRKVMRQESSCRPHPAPLLPDGAVGTHPSERAALFLQPPAKPGHIASLGGPFLEGHKAITLLFLLWEATASVMHHHCWWESGWIIIIIPVQPHRGVISMRWHNGCKKPFKKYKNLSQNNKRTKNIMIPTMSAFYPKWSCQGQAKFLGRPQGFHLNF